MWNVYRFLIVIATMASGGIACVEGSAASAAPKPVFDVQAKREGALNRCMVTARVNYPDRALNLTLTAASEAGVHYRATDAQVSVEQQESMLAEEMREFEFPCRLNPVAAGLSGAYVARVEAVEGGDVVFEDWTTLYVLRGADGSSRFLSGRGEFQEQFTGDFVDGEHNVGYQVELSRDQEFPTGGFLHLMIHSEHDNFAPELTVEVASGIEFVATPDLHPFVQIEASDRVRIQFGPIARNGMRVVAVPFQIRAGSRNGAYRMMITQRAEQATWTEETPFLLELNAHPSVAGQRWVSGVRADQAVVLTPEAQQQVEAPPLGGIGGGSVGADPATATPEPALSSPTPQPEPTAAHYGGEYRWNRPFTGYSGDMRDVYDHYVRPVTSMSWKQFAAEAEQYNSGLAEDGHVFQPDKVYWLPAGR